MSFAVAVVLALASTSPVVRGERPNVVLLLADDLGVECLGCYGGRSYRTPHLDAMAAAGMRFTAAHATPLCTPSRVRLMTGRDSVYNYHSFGILDPREPTLGLWARAAGYRTGAFGKWQLYGTPGSGRYQGQGTSPTRAGFEEWCLWQVEELGARYDAPELEIDGEVKRFSKEDYGPYVVRDHALDFLERHRDEPFFLHYPMILPHDPFRPTPKSAPAAATNPALAFADMVECMDEIVGSVLRKLLDLGLSERTLVIFLADNGTSPDIVSKYGDLEVPGGKGTTTTLGTHVPMIVNWPGVVAAGSEDHGLVDLLDLAPTLADLCGLDVPGRHLQDGYSLAEVLRGEEPERRRSFVHLHFDPRPGLREATRCVFDLEWKLYDDGRLFHLAVDPYEQVPLLAADDDPDRAAARRHGERRLATYPAVGLGRHLMDSARGG